MLYFYRSEGAQAVMQSEYLSLISGDTLRSSSPVRSILNLWSQTNGILNWQSSDD